MRSAFRPKKDQLSSRSHGFDQLLRGSIKRNIKPEKPLFALLYLGLPRAASKCELSVEKVLFSRATIRATRYNCNSMLRQIVSDFDRKDARSAQKGRRETSATQKQNFALYCSTRSSTLHKKGVGFGVITGPGEALLVRAQARERFSLQS
jgi:hypothetical protein